MIRLASLLLVAFTFTACLDAPDAPPAEEVARVDEPTLDGSECPGQGFISDMLPGCKATTCYYQPLSAPWLVCPRIPVPTPCQHVPGYCRVGEMFIGCTGQPTMRWGTTSDCDAESWSNCGNNGAFCGDDSHPLICGQH